MHIGRRMRERRNLLKLTQSEVAELMGFSYQQMQKYESGVSQISTGKLLLFAKILNVPASYFLDGITLDKGIGKRIETNIIQKTRTEPLHILLVDDNAADVILFKQALIVCEPVELHVVHDAAITMNLLKNDGIVFERRLPDVVFLDINVQKSNGQKLNGMGLLASIKKNPKTQSLPVLILTNSISVKDMKESYRCGASGFIQKSNDAKEYEENLKAIIRYWSRIVLLPSK